MAALCHFSLLIPTEQEAKKGVSTLRRISDPNYHEEISLFIDSRIREEYVQNSGDSLGLLLVEEPRDCPETINMGNCSNYSLASV